MDLEYFRGYPVKQYKSAIQYFNICTIYCNNSCKHNDMINFLLFFKSAAIRISICQDSQLMGK